MNYKPINLPVRGQCEIRFTIHERRKSSTLVEYIRQMNFFMQNEPNFIRRPMDVKSVMINRYEKFRLFRNGKNEPKRTQNEPNFVLLVLLSFIIADKLWRT